MIDTSEKDYGRKIKSAAALKQIIGPRPRDMKVIMCHGTFDLVHPGHLRHLMYAKEKGDILIASVTSDLHIEKSNYRPFVPQDLRAMNLAALEIVDYVIIDENAVPLENIALLEPEFFAKGYEYYEGKIRPKTQDEIAVLESYGGEIIFTPGDIVYSSSHIIDKVRPNIAVDKLVALMDAEAVTFELLRAALPSFKDVRVHVVGDTIVDSYTYCSLIGGNAKTPTYSVKYEQQVDFAGGAAVVARHLRAAGSSVYFSTILGDDPVKEFVLGELKLSGVDCHAVTDHSRPTTQKNVFLANGYRMLKVDKLENQPISGKILEQIKAQITDTTDVDTVIFSDFRHGIFSRSTIPVLIGCIPPGVLRVADSQVASRWGNILEFHGFDIITPNEREARFALGDQDTVVRPLALKLYQAAGCKTLILKLGDRGTITYRSAKGDVRDFFTIDSFADRLIDSVGAGDALLAYTTLGVLVTKSPVIGSILGSLAAAVACERDGNYAVSRSDLEAKINLVEKQANYK